MKFRKMEGKNFTVTDLDSALNFLEGLEYEEGYVYLQGSIERLRLELRFLRMLFWGLSYWENVEYDWHIHFVIVDVMPKLSQLARQFGADCRDIHDRGQSIDWEGVICDMEKAIRQFKPQVKHICNVLLSGAFRCTSCIPNQSSFLDYGCGTASFAHIILQNLAALHNSNLIEENVKQQFALIQEKLEVFGAFVSPSDLSITEVKKLYELMARARTWSNRISCLTYLYWVDQGKGDSLASSTETVLSDLLHKTSGEISFYFQRATVPQLLAGYFDFLLQGLVLHLKDDVDILREGLIFLLSFIIDYPEHEDVGNRGIVRGQIYSLINEFPSLFYSIRGEIQGGTSKSMLFDLLLKIDTVKAKVTNLYLLNPYSPSRVNSPNTNAIRFLNSVIGNLRNMSEGEGNLIHSLKDLCELLVTELESLRPVVYNITEVLHEDECEKIKDLRREVMNLVYNADYFIKFLPAKSFSVWYGIIALPNVIEHINKAKAEIEDIGVDKLYGNRNVSTHSLRGLPQGTTSKSKGDFFIAFEEVSRVIVEELTRGQKRLKIISISGSAGQGKTTLAKKILDDRGIMFHFHKIAWCYVSKDCPTREVLVQIIGDDHKGVDIKELEVNDLVDHLRKILKGRRYLVVLDDIWNVEAWRKLEWSFPDDNNGSRLLFTSRNHSLASQAKSNSSSHRLPLFSTEESWELMQKLVFYPEVCPEEFVAVGYRIASYCKGLPLAVSLIAAVLGKTDQKLEMWDGVAEDLKSHLSREGCTNVLELSYNYLPGHLKSCFLYFGAFPRGENISAKKLKLLWIAEGFVHQSSEDLAADYLTDLVSQNLVVVTERSSMDGIKTCNVHDLLFDLCLEKAKEDNFLSWADESLVEDQSGNCSILHRLRIGTSTDSFIKPTPVVSDKKLPTGPLHSLLWSHESYSLEECSYSFFESLKFLMVLDMDINRWVVMERGRFLDVILTMMHLQYLALKFWKSIKEIPPAIANLRNLETLIISSTADTSVSLPASLWKMKRLRHISVRCFRADLKGSCSFSFACSIEKLGSVHLVVSDSRTAKFLQNFPKLKKLECSFRGHISQLFSILASLTQLESLKIIRFPGVQYKSDSFMKIPSVSYAMVENLKKLAFSRLKVPWSVLSEIGKQLPNLQVLKIGEELFGFVGSVWKLEDGDFSNLRYLKLRNLSIEEIDVSNCDDSLPFPCLEHLIVESCIKFKEIPSIFREISTLKTIKVFGCSTEVENSALEILEHQREFGNFDLEVVIRSGYDEHESLEIL